MKVGDIPNDVYNRNAPERQIEMKPLNQPIVTANFSLVPDDVQQWQKQSQQQVGCFDRFFKQNQQYQKPKKDNYKPTKLKDHYDLLDESWFDEQRQQIIQMQTPTPDGNQQVTHIIQPDDTLEGLELQYGVSAYRIRSFNNLQTNDIYYLKKLIIPNPAQDYQKQELDMDKYMLEVKINKFISEICQPEDRTRKVALYYLDIAEWNYRAAALEYLEDYKFELEQYKNKIPYNKTAC